MAVILPTRFRAVFERAGADWPEIDEEAARRAAGALRAEGEIRRAARAETAARLVRDGKLLLVDLAAGAVDAPPGGPADDELREAAAAVGELAAALTTLVGPVTHRDAREAARFR